MDNKPEQELRALAVDLAEDKIFTDRHLPEHERHNFSLVFMVFIFMSQEQINRMDDLGLVYEYIDKAGPRSVNGMPIFMSACYLNKHDTALLFQFAREYKELKAKFVSDIPAVRPPIT